MRNSNLLFAFVLTLFVFGCGEQSKKWSEKDLVEVPVSHLAFNINFPAEELQAGVNEVLKPVLVDDIINMNDKGDKLYLKVVKKGDLKISLDNDQAKGVLPLSVEVAIKKKMMGITFSNEDTPISFTGQIIATTTASLDENWNFKLHCQAMELIWDQEPRLNVLGIEIDLTKTMENALESNEEKILDQICSSVNKAIDFRKAFSKIYTDIQRPIRIAKQPDTLWLYSRPHALNAQLMPLDHDLLSIHIEYKSTVHITNQSKVNWPIEELPTRGNSLSDRSAILAYVEAKVPFEFISGIMEEKLLGQSFEYEQYSATVKDIAIKGKEGKMEVTLKLVGDVNGSLIMTGRPFLTKDGKLTMDGFSFEVISDDKIATAADWITHSFIETYVANRVFVDASDFLGRLDHLANAGIAKSNVGNKLATTFDFNEISSYKQSIQSDMIQWIFYVEGKGDLNLKQDIFQKKKQ